MKKLVAMYCVVVAVISTLTTVHAAQVAPSAVGIDITFYEDFDDSVLEKDEYVNQVFIRGNQVEFFTNPKKIGAWSFDRPILHDDNSEGGYVLELSDGDKQKAWYFMPTTAWAVLSTKYQFRITAYRVLGNKKLSNCLGFNFEIEGEGPWVIDGKPDAHNQKTARLDDTSVARIAGLKACDSELCGYNPKEAVACPWVPAGQWYPQDKPVW